MDSLEKQMRPGEAGNVGISTANCTCFRVERSVSWRIRPSVLQRGSPQLIGYEFPFYVQFAVFFDLFGFPKLAPLLVGSHHKERDPRKGGRVIQKMSNNRRNQASAAQKVRYAPHHSEKSGG